MTKKTKKCLGCKKNIPVSRNKYCGYECYAKQMAPVWGMSRKQAKGVAAKASERHALAVGIRNGR